MRDPVFMYDSIVVPAGALRNVILKNPSKTPIMVTEIRFGYSINLNAGQHWMAGNPADLVRANIKVCNWDITAGRHIPLMLLCPFTDDANAWLGISDPGGGRASLVWKLPKPMLLPYNGQITFDFMLADDFVDPDTGSAQTLAACEIASVTVDVAFVAQTLDTKPFGAPLVSMPYAAHWMGPAGGGPVLDGIMALRRQTQSTPADLKNARPYPLHVAHMTAVCMASASMKVAGVTHRGFLDVFGDVSGGPMGATALTGIFSSTNTANVTTEDGGLRLQMRDTRGGFVMRDPTPLALVFPPGERAWRMKALLAPNQYYIATLNTNRWNDDVERTAPIATGYLHANIPRVSLGLIGHHEVPIADLGVFP